MKASDKEILDELMELIASNGLEDFIEMMNAIELTEATFGAVEDGIKHIASARFAGLDLDFEEIIERVGKDFPLDEEWLPAFELMQLSLVTTLSMIRLGFQRRGLDVPELPPLR